MFWFSIITAGSALPAHSVRELDDVGFVVIPDPVAPPQRCRWSSAPRARKGPAVAPGGSSRPQPPPRFPPRHLRGSEGLRANLTPTGECRSSWGLEKKWRARPELNRRPPA
jgi:hypothetical protein